MPQQSNGHEHRYRDAAREVRQRDEALFPNEFREHQDLVDTLTQTVLVPTPAVLSGAPGNYVYFANPNNTVSVRKVTLGASDGSNTASYPASPRAMAWWSTGPIG